MLVKRRIAMLRLTLPAMLIAGWLLAAPAKACGGYGSLCPEVDSPEFVEFAMELRQRGPDGLAIALRQFEQASDETERATRRALVDLVAAQRDATVSKLYWYADFNDAKRAAAESGRPILSLRMLGKLTDEYSCANSRFFRTALYANREISDYLRDNFVLHWQSVRPVPRVTVDFGDGRKLERTVTGNSAHYVLDALGRPIDVLPGLYGPLAFKSWLERTKEFADRLAPVSSDIGRTRLLQEYHGWRRLVVEEELREDLAAVAPELIDAPQEPSIGQTSASQTSTNHPTAMQAASRAVTKSVAEAALVAPFAPSRETLAAQDVDFWQAIATRRQVVAKLDPSSRALLQCKVPPAIIEGADRATASKRAVENPLLKLVSSFERSMAIDTVKNEYLLHRQIHQWFVDGEAPNDVDALNERVYAELFLTPSSDPWLGLAPTDVYTALDDGGLTETQAAK
jgi:hypothetical protein